MYSERVISERSLSFRTTRLLGCEGALLIICMLLVYQLNWDVGKLVSRRWPVELGSQA